MSKLKVFYRPEQTVTDAESFSPSAGKPAEVLQSWLDLGLPIEVQSFKPLTRKQISLAHDPAYVDGVLNGVIPNGFGNTLKGVADSLPYTTGSMAAAALYAFKTGNPAASLTSGFHHAAWDHAAGFTTFEGLAIATRLLLKAGAKKVGILDLDMHFGNTMAILDGKLGLKGKVRHYTFGGERINSANADQWLKKLPRIVCNFRDCDVILFQLGADPFVEDPLGGVLTMDQLRERDLIAFSAAKRMGVPVAWNLAGGYTNPFSKVLEIHANSAKACIEVYGKKKHPRSLEEKDLHK
jgi:acetoin utilization deacetylase AcuC-like enzyme